MSFFTRIARLLDFRGNRVEPKGLTRTIATPSLAGYRQRRTDSVASGLTPERLAKLLQAAREGDLEDYLTLADEMEENDNHYRSVLGTRRMAVSGLEVMVEGISGVPRGAEIVEAVQRLTSRPEFEGLVDGTLDALGKGFSVSEIIWPEERGSIWYPEAYEWKDPRWFVYDQESGMEIRLRDQENPVEGVPLEPFKFIVHEPRLKMGVPYRRGLALAAGWQFMFKRFTVRDWMAFAEVYGMPLRVGKYGKDAGNEDIDALREALFYLGSDAAGVIPESTLIELHSVTSGQSGPAVYENLARYLDEQLSKLILGQTMTSDNGSSMAQAKIHNEVRLDIVESDARQVAATINRDLIRPFIELNFGALDEYPWIHFHIPDDLDLNARATQLRTLVELGVEIAEDEVREEFGYRKPAPGERTLALGASSRGEPAVETARQQRGCSCRSGTKVYTARQLEELDDIDEAVEEAVAQWEPVMEPIVDPLLEVIRNANSLEEVRAFLEAFTDADETALGESLAARMFRARVDGETDDD